MDARGVALGDSKHATEFTLKVFAAAGNPEQKEKPFKPQTNNSLINEFIKKIIDREDRAGKASTNTARTFMAASAFFDVLQQFGALPTDLVDMRKYCKWKAADILKAIKEGRKPDIGGPLSAEEKELNAMMAADASSLPEPDFASASTATNKLSPRLNSAPPSSTAASNPTVIPPPSFNTASSTDDELHLPSVPSSLTSSSANIAAPPPDVPASFDDDVSALLGNMPSVPKPSTSKPPPTQQQHHQQPPPTTTNHPPPTTTTPQGPPPTYQSSVAANVASNTAEIRQMYETMLRAQSEQMLQLHQEQEKQMQELRALSERQAAQIAKLAAAPPASARKPATSHSFVTAAAAAAAAKNEELPSAAKVPEVHIPGAVSELLPVEKIDTELAFKHAKYIVSSLQYDDYTQAFKELKMVAKMLCGGDALTLNEAIPKK
jgi:vacuolar protein sorting-associated protein VTA1